ncbi:MAG: hypothetical protein WAL95_19250 [Candidatus Acidiferrales bacterium]
MNASRFFLSDGTSTLCSSEQHYKAKTNDTPVPDLKVRGEIDVLEELIRVRNIATKLDCIRLVCSSGTDNSVESADIILEKCWRDQWSGALKVTKIRRQGSPWTDDERSLLVRMREGNHDVASIAATLKRPIESVYAVCKRLVRTGQLGSKRGRPWTTRELAALGNITLRDEQLAGLLGRTKAAVKKKRLGLSLRPRIREPWSVAQDSQLIEMREEGSSFSEIARALHRSEFAVSNRVHHLVKRGNLVPLSEVERSRRGGISSGITREDRWSDNERETILALWKGGNTAAEINAASKRSVSAIQNLLGALRKNDTIGRLPAADVRTRLVRARQRQRSQRCRTAEEFIAALPNTVTAGYVIGVLYGDGFISVKRSGSIGLKSTNESFCLAFAEALQETFQRKTRLLSRIEPLKKIGDYEYRNVRYYEAFLHSTHLALALRKAFGHTDEWRWCSNPDKIMRIGERFAGDSRLLRC